MKIKFLINPFETVSEKKLLVYGIVATLIASYIAYLLNGRFDGAIDLHFTENVGMFQPLIDSLINFTSLFVFLFGAGRIINSKTRAVDIATPILVAKIPYYILLAFNINNFMYEASMSLVKNISTENPSVMPNLDMGTLATVTIFGLISIVFLVWFFALLYYGSKTATNGKTIAHKFYFVGAIILAEILSSVLISNINY